MKAAPTPRTSAKIIENNPYKIGISTDNFFINIYNGLRSLASIFVATATPCSAKKVS